ncbi:MAG: VCBS repeat-containing protein [Limisphaerales bacterium]
MVKAKCQFLFIALALLACFHSVFAQGTSFVLASSPGVGTSPDYVCAADVNGDGKVDLICANFYPNGNMTVLTNDGSSGFVLASTLGAGATPDSVCAADVNNDGKMDLICANDSSHTLTVLTNNGSGGFVLASTLDVGSGPESVCAADISGDGKLDLISANSGDNTLTVLTNATIFPAPTTIPPLTITTLGLGMRVIWPSASAGWSLQQNPDLTAPNWGVAGYNGHGISDDGTNKSLTLPQMSGNLFFRLLHP